MTEIEILKAIPYRNAPHWWEWEIPVYLFLGGIAGGLLLLAALRALVDPDGPRSGPFRHAGGIALVLLSLGMLALWFDLEKRWQAYRFYLAFRPAAPM
ncbi:MAG: hypothetical protein GF346_02490, partial [Candidatus Eisenbacteria bacterium]|nr:hypothetical protein [Candidatus Latescibacterota bacterium]MBD3301290.1 hypothetical protein [Candidatus Eisenbacteria bacterium]